MYDSGKDLFVIGETSSGKTLIPMLMYYAAYQEAREKQQRTSQMLFVVPYRALAAQKKLEIERLFQGEELDIVQSIGEHRQNDDEIQRGEVDIAVIITEKVYRYESKDSTFLSRYDFLVIDEIGLLNDNFRGGDISVVANFIGTKYVADSSFASAVHIPIKLAMCGDTDTKKNSVDTLKEAIRKKNKLYWSLVALEHRRRNAYTVTRGFRLRC